jgi:hypothetical protein
LRFGCAKRLVAQGRGRQGEAGEAGEAGGAGEKPGRIFEGLKRISGVIEGTHSSGSRGASRHARANLLTLSVGVLFQKSRQQPRSWPVFCLRVSSARTKI